MEEIFKWLNEVYTYNKVWDNEKDSKDGFEDANIIITTNEAHLTDLGKKVGIFRGLFRSEEYRGEHYAVTYNRNITMFTPTCQYFSSPSTIITWASHRPTLLSLFVTRYNESLHWYNVHLKALVSCGAVTLTVFNKGLDDVAAEPEFLIKKVKNVGLAQLDIAQTCRECYEKSIWVLFTQTKFADHMDVSFLNSIHRLLEGKMDGFDLISLSRAVPVLETDWSEKIWMSEQYSSYVPDETFMTGEQLYEKCGFKRDVTKSYFYAEGPIFAIKQELIKSIDKKVYELLCAALETGTRPYISHTIERLWFALFNNSGKAKVLVTRVNYPNYSNKTSTLIVQREAREGWEGRLAAFNEMYASTMSYGYCSVPGPDPELITEFKGEAVACVSLIKSLNQIRDKKFEWLLFIGPSNSVRCLTVPTDILVHNVTYEILVTSAYTKNIGNAVLLRNCDAAMPLLLSWLRLLSVGKSLSDLGTDAVLLLHETMFSVEQERIQAVPFLCARPKLVPFFTSDVLATAYINGYKRSGNVAILT
jgi:hypothetical protein